MFEGEAGLSLFLGTHPPVSHEEVLGGGRGGRRLHLSGRVRAEFTPVKSILEESKGSIRTLQAQQADPIRVDGMGRFFRQVTVDEFVGVDQESIWGDS